MTTKLILMAQSDAPGAHTWEVSERPVVIGRNADVQVQLESPTVGRRHASIQRVGSGFEITDLKSLNGTFVNGESVAGRRQLADGDCVTISDVPLFVHIVAEEGAQQVPTLSAATLVDKERTAYEKPVEAAPVTPQASPPMKPTTAPSLSCILDDAERTADNLRTLQRLVAVKLGEFERAGGRAAVRQIAAGGSPDTRQVLEAALRLIEVLGV